MKKSRTLIIYYVITLLLSLISIISFKNKGNDFFAATSSITADLTLIISIITITVGLLYCCSYIKESLFKKEKNFDKKIIYTLLILLLTLIIVFISFINVFSHKNIIEFITNLINKHENIDILKLFIESFFIYIFIYLCTINGLIINNLFLDENSNYFFPVCVIVGMILIAIVLLKFGISMI